MSTSYNLTIPSLSATETFCTIEYDGTPGDDATYTDCEGNTSTLEDFSWNGTFSIELPNPSGPFPAGEYTFSGGLAKGQNEYKGRVSVPDDEEEEEDEEFQDQGKDWVATEG